MFTVYWRMVGGCSDAVWVAGLDAACEMVERLLEAGAVYVRTSSEVCR